MKERKTGLNHNWAEIQKKGIFVLAFIALFTSCTNLPTNSPSFSKDLINEINAACKDTDNRVCQSEIIPRYTDLYKYHCIAWLWDSQESQLITNEGIIYPAIQDCPEDSIELRSKDIDGVCQFLLDNGTVPKEDDFSDTNFKVLCVLK